MDYNAFRSEIRKRVSLAADRGSEVMLRSVRKINGVTLDGITIMEHGTNTAPTIYLGHYYDMYREGCSLDLIVGYILRENRARQIREFPVDFDLRDFGQVRPRLGLQLINADMNRELLFGVPHIRVLDLAAICYVRLAFPESDHAAVKVKNEDLVTWDVGETELFREALHMSIENEPAVAMPLWKMLEELSGCGDEECGKDENEILYVLTNRSRIFGASCILYPHVLEEQAKYFGTDLVIIPSSIHEVLLAPRDIFLSKEECDALVSGVNATEVAPFEVLSNHVYFYSRSEGKIEM